MIPLRDVNPTRSATPITWLLIAGVAAVFFLVQPRSDTEGIQFLYDHAAIPCEITTGGPLTVDEVRTGRCDTDATSPEVSPGKHVAISLLTSIFLHGSVLHLLGNLWILWIFGNNVEDDLGSSRFAAFYLLAGIVASIGHVALHARDTVPVVGASGAIAGVMGAYLVLHPTARVVSVVFPLVFLPFRTPAAVYLVVWLGLQFALADRDTNIAWEAHLVGFAFGISAALLLRASGVVASRRRRSSSAPR